jgi:hypothetical protein
MPQSFRILIVVASAAALLAGCSSDKPNNCPAVSSIVETSIGTVFRPGTIADPSNVLYTVEITDMHAKCDVDKPGLNSDSTVTVSFRATRGPNGGEAHYKIPYFIAISETDRILAKKIYSIEFTFQPGQTTTTFSDSIGSVAVSAGKDKKTFDYLVLVGLQLSEEQLKFNRASGRLAP